MFVVHALPPYFAAAHRSRNLKAKQRATQMLCGVLNAYEAWGKGEDFQVGKPRCATPLSPISMPYCNPRVAPLSLCRP